MLTSGPDDRLALAALVHILEEIAGGNAVTIIPVHAELTTQEAADMLTISRPSLIQLLDEGKIEYRRVGTHRRVRFEALMAYKRRADAERRAVLAKLTAYGHNVHRTLSRQCPLPVRVAEPAHASRAHRIVPCEVVWNTAW